MSKGPKYLWRVDHRFGIRWLVLLNKRGKELRARMCLATDAVLQAQMVESMILDYEKNAGRPKLV